MVGIGAPGELIIVKRYGPCDAKPSDRGFDIGQIFFMGELWGVDADNYQAIIRIFFMPFPHRGNHVATINSAIGPEFDHDHFAA